MRVLSVASECVPLVKTGGLADVAGALPGALASHGVEMRTLLPGYPAVMKALEQPVVVSMFPDVMGGSARLLSGRGGGLDLLVLDAPHLYDRAGTIYLNEAGQDWQDNPQRYAALSMIAAKVANGAVDHWRPDVVHCHDWQAALAPYYIARSARQVPTVLTIHNIAFQGLTSSALRESLGIAQDDFTPDGVEFWGYISALKAGIVFAQKITTVSPTYARELMTESFGMGLEGVLRMRHNDVTGILNGVDRDTWDPQSDPLIVSYDAPEGKRPNKAALRREFGLGEAAGPLCVVISRLTDQKGLDLLLEALPHLLDCGGQLALLGSGAPDLEDSFARAAAHPDVGVHIGYDEALAHRMIAGGDAILVPSRFEPCGLTQLYGLRYGTLPVVSLTGGLADTVIPATPATMAKQVATGVQFYPATADALRDALSQICDLYSQPEIWLTLQRNAMKHPVGWDQSARAYASLYRGLMSYS